MQLVLTLKCCYVRTILLQCEKDPHIGVCNYDFCFPFLSSLLVLLPRLWYFRLPKGLSLFLFVFYPWLAFFFVFVVAIRWTDATELETRHAATLPTCTDVSRMWSPAPKFSIIMSLSEGPNPFQCSLSFLFTLQCIQTMLLYLTLVVVLRMGVARLVTFSTFLFFFFVLVLFLCLRAAVISFHPRVKH